MASARRELLLRVHRFRLRREDLEDCYSQATLELMERARAGVGFKSRAHLQNVLEQRFLSRIHDRRRAVAGRSPIQAALEGATSLGGLAEEQVQVVDRRAELEALVLLRQDLRRLGSLMSSLSPDQRLVLACQVGQMVVAGLRLDTSHNGTDTGPNRLQDGPRWRVLDHIPTWARWSVRHPPGL